MLYSRYFLVSYFIYSSVKIPLLYLNHLLMIVLLIILLLLYETIIKLKKQTNTMRDFPGGPIAKTLSFQCRGPSLIPGQGTR